MLQSVETLTPRQEEILGFISDFFTKKRMPPTIREIQTHFKLESTNGVVEHLAQLERKGYLRRRPGISRGLELVSKSASFHPGIASVPILGQIAAGTPILAEENIEGLLHLDKTLIRGDGHFLLKVRGESMKGAGIFDGDLVLVKKQPRAETGEIVAAYLNGEATVKHFHSKRGAIELKPANPAFSVIRVTKEKHPDFQILGVVRAVLRVF